MGELKTVVNNWFNTGLVITKHNMEIIKVLNRYDECLDINVKLASLSEEYFEKCLFFEVYAPKRFTLWTTLIWFDKIFL